MGLYIYSQANGITIAVLAAYAPEIVPHHVVRVVEDHADDLEVLSTQLKKIAEVHLKTFYGTPSKEFQFFRISPPALKFECIFTEPIAVPPAAGY